MISTLTIVRWVHMLSAAAWLGEVLLIAFVMVPSIATMDVKARASYIGTVFPRVFRMASIAVALVLLSGLYMNYLLTGWQNMLGYIQSFRGMMVTIGGVLGLLLGVFHFVVEARIEGRVIRLAEEIDAGELESILRYLRIIPRVGLVILIVVFLSMMIAARGL